MTHRLEAENAQLRARLATIDTIAGTENTRLSSTLDQIEADTPTTGRATCRMHTARGRRCTAEPLDTDPKVVQVCARHAAEVMTLINERATQ